jgi:hypothetical protein
MAAQLRELVIAWIRKTHDAREDLNLRPPGPVSENLKPWGCRTCKHRQPKNPASVGPPLVHKRRLASVSNA